MRGVSATAATGSAHDLPQMAFTAKPASAIQAIYAHREDSAASAFRAALDVMAANCRFRPASQGITTAAANKIPIPTRLRCASRYPRKFEPKTPEHDGCRKQLDQAVSSESVESGTMRTPSRPERSDSLYGHSGDGENLKLKNAPRDIRQLG